jgi:hypothetical protein
VRHRGQQHATGAAGGIVYCLPFLRIEDINHETNDAARGENSPTFLLVVSANFLIKYS